MLSISPRWLVHLLPWWRFDAGLPAEQDTCQDIDALIAALPRIATRSEAPEPPNGIDGERNGAYASPYF
jgi:hypothetical protein